MTRAHVARILLPLALLAAGCAVATQGPALKTAVTAPDLGLRDQRGREVRLAGLTAAGPAVLVFYRGHW